MENKKYDLSFVKKLPLEIKAKMVVGYSTWKTYPSEKYEIPSLVFSDGPTGIRKEKENLNNELNGLSKTYKATCFPVSSALASSFDVDLIYEVGVALGKEAKYYGVNYLLAPPMNIKRNPLCGRNFEYYSEDPILSGKLASAIVKGIQSQKVGATIKHYLANVTEKWRYVGDSIIDERALREIYLRNFEIPIKEGNAKAVMTSYNKINNQHANENDFTLVHILRNEWEYDGLVISDWGGNKDRVKALICGSDVEMPGMTPLNINRVIKAIKNKEISEDFLDFSVLRILKAIEFSKEKIEINGDIFEQNYSLAVKAASESAVLLKNNGLLPLKNDKEYLIIGDLFKSPHYQGGGSSQVNPYKIIDNEEAFKNNGIKYSFVKGYNEYEDKVDDLLIRQSLVAAENYDEILLFIGLTRLSESEGFDRDDILLPYNQRVLINELVKLNKKIIAITYGGSSFIIPQIDKIDSILHMNLPGEGMGDALVNLLLGKINPCGRTNETWVKSYDDVPFGKEYAISRNELFKESIYVGYRYYISANKEVLFPFGYGLSYSKVIYSDLMLEDSDKQIKVTFKIKNNGPYAGKFVPQIYIGKEDSALFRPKYELKGFTKIFLDNNEEKNMTIEIDKHYLEVFDETNSTFVLEDGVYQIYLATSSTDISLKKSIYLKGEKIKSNYIPEIKNIYFDAKNITRCSNELFLNYSKVSVDKYIYGKKPFTIETPINEFGGFFGNLVKKILIDSSVKEYKKNLKKDKSDSEKALDEMNIKFVSRTISYNSLRSLAYSSSGLVSESMANGLLELANGHILKSINFFTKKEKIDE